MRVIEQVVLTFEECSPDLQKTILDRYRDINIEDYNWWDWVYAHWKEKLEALGFYDLEFSFSGFSSQGDGASFTGKMEDFTQVMKQITGLDQDYSQTDRTWEIYRISSHYSHERSTSHNFEIYSDREENELDGWFEGVLKIWYITTCQQFYRELEKEYEGLTSDESVRNMLIANHYEFDETGKMVY